MLKGSARAKAIAMKNRLREQLLKDVDAQVLEAASPQHLKSLLKSQAGQRGRKRFVRLVVNDPKLLTKTFHLTDVPLRKVREAIQYEAVELLGLPIDEVEFDFQILHSAGKTVDGVFICADKKTLERYFTIADQAGIVLLEIVGYTIAGVNAVFQNQAINAGRISILDFSKEGELYISIFNDLQCELLRALPNYRPQQVRTEIVQSLRCVCGQSHHKDFDHIYLIGKVFPEDQEALTAELNSSLGIPTDRTTALDTFSLNSSGKKIMNLNLAKNYSLSLPSRRLSFAAANALIGIGMIIAVIFGMQKIMLFQKVAAERATLTEADYQAALALQKELVLDHVGK